MIKIKVPATSANLGSGFDCLGLALDLYNIVTISPSSINSVSIKNEGSDNEGLKKNNMFLSIFTDIYQNLTRQKPKFRYVFENNIPFTRGLGSSSSIVISAIIGAYHCAKVSIGNDALLKTALTYENHLDNLTPAIYGGFTCSVSDDQTPKHIKIDISDEICALLVIPDFPMSTAASRTQLPVQLHIKDVVFNLSRISLLSLAFATNDWSKLKIASQDKIHENIRTKEFPILNEIKKTALNEGAYMSTLSGSGSTIINIVDKKNAKSLKNKLQNRFKEYKIEIFGFNNSGFEIIKN